MHDFSELTQKLTHVQENVSEKANFQVFHSQIKGRMRNDSHLPKKDFSKSFWKESHALFTVLDIIIYTFLPTYFCIGDRNLKKTSFNRKHIYQQSP